MTVSRSSLPHSPNTSSCVSAVSPCDGWHLSLKACLCSLLGYGQENTSEFGNADLPEDSQQRSHATAIIVNSFSRDNWNYSLVLLIFCATWTTPLHPLPTLTSPSKRMGTLAFLVMLFFQLKDDLTMPMALSIRRYIGLLSSLGILLQFSDLPSNRFCDWCHLEGSFFTGGQIAHLLTGKLRWEWLSLSRHKY